MTDITEIKLNTSVIEIDSSVDKAYVASYVDSAFDEFKDEFVYTLPDSVVEDVDYEADKTRLADTSGVNTGDQVLPTLTSDLTNDWAGISN